MLTRLFSSHFAINTRLLMLAGLLSLTGCAINPVTGDSDFVLMSEDDEIAIGRKNHPKIIEQYGLYEDPALQRYVQRIGDKLAAKSHRSNLLYRFTVLDSAQINAFALPGGYIYITRGLLAYLNNEAQLAAVLGHEIGHVTARHGVRQQSASAATGLLAAILASQAGFAGADNISNALGAALVSGYGRDHELESDGLGAEYLARTGYDPNAMLEVIKVLKDQEVYDRAQAKKEGREPQTYHGLFASHPDNDTRLQSVVGKANKLKVNDNGEKVKLVTFLQNMEGLVYGDSEAQGIQRGRNFYHKDLGITIAMPEGWRTENQPSRLIAIAPNNAAVLQIQSLDRNKRLSPENFLRQRLKLKRLRSGEAFNHNGFQGYTAVATADTPYGLRFTRYIVLYKGDKAWVFLGAAKDSNKPYQYDKAILDTARSFRPLRKHEIKLAKAMKLHIVVAKKDRSFDTLAKSSRISNDAEGRLRLLNHYYPKGEPPLGTPLKIVK